MHMEYLASYPMTELSFLYVYSVYRHRGWLSEMTSVLVSVLLLPRDTMISNLIKENLLIGADLQFRNLVHCCHRGKHGSMQADMELESN